MSWESFTTCVPGKWVLTGEHSVLRGATAIALPHSDLGLTLSFEPTNELSGEASGLEILPDEVGNVMQGLIDAVAESIQSEGRSFSSPKGKLRIESSIPIGAGLGSSAALCVALTRWMGSTLSLPKNKWTEFATRLEHRFHGRSSGMDVAVISAGEPISYMMGQGITSIGVKKLPRFTFHDTGMRCRTSECVQKVEKFREEIPEVAQRVDDSMSEASRRAMYGLISYDNGDKEEGLKLLTESMQLARECFYAWKLVPGEARRIEENLLRDGALAVKITGAGGGGMIVALWPE